MDRSEKFDHILKFAQVKGVSDALIISPEIIPVNDKFVRFCKEPGCPGYGQSMSCPPHAKGPDWFRSRIKTHTHVLIFKFDVPTTSLLGIERLDLLGLIHETAAQLETLACDMRFERSIGLAGGSCKEVFCNGFANCRVLHEGEECRNPDRARQSMSAVKINFLKLSKAVGWKMKLITQGTDPKKVPMGMVAGLVLLD
jgi:predicted metal-binding protein